MKVVWFYRAVKSLEEIGDYIAQDNPSAAYGVVIRIKKAGDALARNPSIGRPGRVEGTRELIVTDTPYILPYRIHGNEIQILHVFHAARQWPETF
jgi:toxin ParE1/3/4